MPGIEQPPQPRCGRISPDAGEGVSVELRRPGEAEPGEREEYVPISLSELDPDPLVATNAGLADHGSTGLRTGRPQVGHGVQAADSWHTEQRPNTQPSNRAPQWQSNRPYMATA